MKHHVIGLTGYARVGKDTVADLLVTHLNFRKMAFADALRAEVAEGFGVDLIYLTRPDLKNEPIKALRMALAPADFFAHATRHIPGIPRDENGMITVEWLHTPRSPRQILQWWGTEYRRKLDPRYWTKLMHQRLIETSRMGYSRFVITDVRFVNEAETMEFFKAQIWQITRPGIDGASTVEGQHTSVTDGTEFKPHAVINNCHDIRHLQQLVLGLYLSKETGIERLRVEVA